MVKRGFSVLKVDFSNEINDALQATFKLRETQHHRRHLIEQV